MFISPRKHPRLAVLLENFLSRCFALSLLCASLNALGQATSVPVYSDLIPTSSGLPFDPATDFSRHFIAANGKDVEVLVKGPQGSGTYTRVIIVAYSGKQPNSL